MDYFMYCYFKAENPTIQNKNLREIKKIIRIRILKILICVKEGGSEVAISERDLNNRLFTCFCKVKLGQKKNLQKLGGREEVLGNTGSFSCNSH